MIIRKLELHIPDRYAMESYWSQKPQKQQSQQFSPDSVDHCLLRLQLHVDLLKDRQGASQEWDIYRLGYLYTVCWWFQKRSLAVAARSCPSGNKSLWESHRPSWANKLHLFPHRYASNGILIKTDGDLVVFSSCPFPLQAQGLQCVANWELELSNNHYENWSGDSMHTFALSQPKEMQLSRVGIGELDKRKEPHTKKGMAKWELWLCTNMNSGDSMAKWEWRLSNNMGTGDSMAKW